MMNRWPARLDLLVGSLAVLAPSIPAAEGGRALFNRENQTAPGRRSSPDARSLVKVLLAGPDVAERRAGLTTAIDPETRLLGLTEDGDRIKVDLSPPLPQGGGILSC